MENNEPITINDKKRLISMLHSEEGKLFMKLVKDMRQNHLDLAQSMYLRVVNPNEQICANVHQAGGIGEIISFVESIEQEVKEIKKEEQEKNGVE